MQLAISLACIDLLPRDIKVTAHNFRHLYDVNKTAITMLCLDEAFSKISEALQMRCENPNHIFDYQSLEHGNFQIKLTKENSQRLSETMKSFKQWILPEDSIFVQVRRSKETYKKKYDVWLRWYAKTADTKDYDLDFIKRFNIALNIEHSSL